MNKTLCAGTVLVCALIAGCQKKPVEIKRDTPQATVATLIKLYASERDIERVSELVDPLFTTLPAAGMACFREKVADGECLDRSLSADLSGYSRPSCEMNTFAPCVCGEKGKKAVLKATPYMNSAEHQGFIAAGLHPDRCEITSSTSVKVSDATPWEKAMCGAGGSSDKYQRVFFKCRPEGSKKTLDFGVFLRSADGTEPWALFAIDTDTSAMFQGRAMEEGGAKRRESLNEDLK